MPHFARLGTVRTGGAPFRGLFRTCCGRWNPVVSVRSIARWSNSCGIKCTCTSFPWVPCSVSVDVLRRRDTRGLVSLGVGPSLPLSVPSLHAFEPHFPIARNSSFRFLLHFGEAHGCKRDVCDACNARHRRGTRPPRHRSLAKSDRDRSGPSSCDERDPMMIRTDRFGTPSGLGLTRDLIRRGDGGEVLNPEGRQMGQPFGFERDSPSFANPKQFG